jgi:hypothetical protein
VNKKYISIIIIFTLFFSFYGYVNAEYQDGSFNHNETDRLILLKEEEIYGIQWSKNYGPGSEGGRFEGPQPIGDCDNDGENEINVAPVFVDEGMDYISWIFKYGWE